MSQELKPCPFGWRHDKDYETRLVSNGLASNFIECDCGASGPPGDNEEEAVKYWNHRAKPITPAQVERIASKVSELTGYLPCAQMAERISMIIAEVLAK